MKTPSSPRSAPTDPARLLFSDYHLKLLGVLLMRPEQAFHVRELERLTGLSAGTAHRELRRMQRAGLLTAQRVGNQVRYRADPSCVLFPELQGIVRKTAGLAEVLRTALEPQRERIAFAFVFGSMADGSAGPASDIDLLVVGDASFREVVTAIHPAQEALARPVNPVVMTPAIFRERRQDAGFVARILGGPRVPVMGGLDDA